MGAFGLSSAGAGYLRRRTGEEQEVGDTAALGGTDREPEGVAVLPRTPRRADPRGGTGPARWSRGGEPVVYFLFSR